MAFRATAWIAGVCTVLLTACGDELPSEVLEERETPCTNRSSAPADDGYDLGGTQGQESEDSAVKDQENKSDQEKLPSQKQEPKKETDKSQKTGKDNSTKTGNKSPKSGKSGCKGSGSPSS